ncbi:MAG: transferase hexapeptide repeat family protein [Alphaproteobacteria bacterium]|jgi:phenylacetic acid degradation protein|nr:transferase hexapeptide repeat family protein [Alphaproteobacteria bacterium]HJP23372.1 transferase hexapeptide repeat family protein [Alphaproteobacteria bacterium]
MACVYAFEGIVPVVDPSSYLHPQAVLIGDVIVGPHCYVGPGVSLRGDYGRIVIGGGSNAQDNVVMHSFPGAETRVGEECHIGHGVVLHGCELGQNVLVGMNAVVMDGAEVGADSFIGALAFVKGNDKIPPRSLVAGIPARVVRELSEDDVSRKSRGTAQYQWLARRCHEGLVASEPLAEIDAGRPRAHWDESIRPLHEKPDAS